MQDTIKINTDLSLTTEQETGVRAAVDNMLSITETVRVEQHNPATHVLPSNLRSRLVLMDHITVTEPEPGGGPGTLSIHFRAVDYWPAGSDAANPSEVSGYLRRHGRASALTAADHPDHGMQFIDPWPVTDDAAIVGVRTLPGRRAFLPGATEALLTEARIRLAA